MGLQICKDLASPCANSRIERMSLLPLGRSENIDGFRSKIMTLKWTMKQWIIIWLVATLPAFGQVQYAFTNFIGHPGISGSSDGTGTNAYFGQTFSLARDSSDNLYVSDFDNHTIRKVTPAGVVTTFA